MLALPKTTVRSNGLLPASLSLAERINAEHRACLLAANDALDHALRCGDLLIEAKAGVVHGEWAQWLADNFSGSARTARVYTRLAARRDEIEAKRQATAIFTIEQATQLVAEPSENGRPLIATLHGDGQSEWYTPAKYVELAQEAMGGIDLDPATCDFAQKTVKAKRYFTAEDDGLSRKWSGRVFLNPPYKQPLCKQFVGKLCDEIGAGHVVDAILLTNDQTDTHWWHHAVSLAAAVCFLKGRIHFYNEHAGEVAAPTNGQTFCYFGPRPAKFAKVFGQVGLVLPGGALASFEQWIAAGGAA